MSTKNKDPFSNLKIAIGIILFIGLLYAEKHIIPLPMIIIILCPIISYATYKDKIPFLKDMKDGRQIFFIIATFSFIVMSTNKYESVGYVGSMFTDGREVTKYVTMTASEGDYTWEELKTFWETDSPEGEKILDRIFYLGLLLSILSIYLSLKFGTKESVGERKERLEKIERERRKWDPEYKIQNDPNTLNNQT